MNPFDRFAMFCFIGASFLSCDKDPLITVYHQLNRKMLMCKFNFCSSCESCSDPATDPFHRAVIEKSFI